MVEQQGEIFVILLGW